MEVILQHLLYIISRLNAHGEMSGIICVASIIIFYYSYLVELFYKSFKTVLDIMVLLIKYLVVLFLFCYIAWFILMNHSTIFINY